MRKYLLVGVVVLLVAAAFWLGTLVQSRHPILPQASEAETRPENIAAALKILEALQEMRKWQYPGSRVLQENQQGRLCMGVYTTPDDLEKVAKHYGDIPTGYDHVGGAHQDDNGRVGEFNDSQSVLDSGYEKRPLRLGFKVRDSGEATVTIAVSRGDSEKLTHIAIVYVQKK